MNPPQSNYEAILAQVLALHQAEFVLVIDRRGVVRHAGQAVERIAGSKQVQWVGKSLMDCVGAKDRANLLTAFSQVKGAADQVVVDFDLAFSTLPKPPLMRARVLDFLQHPAIEGYVMFVADAAQVQAARAAMAAGQERFEQLIENASDLICIFNQRGRVLYASPSLHAVLGIEQSRVLGRRLLSLIHPRDRRDAMRYGKQLNQHNPLERANQSSERILLRAPHGAGYWRWISALVADARSNASIGGFIINARDVTEEFESRRTLENAKQRQTEFRRQIMALTQTPNAGTRSYLRKVLEVASHTLRADNASYWRLRNNDFSLACEMSFDRRSNDLLQTDEKTIVSLSQHSELVDTFRANRFLSSTNLMAQPGLAVLQRHIGEQVTKGVIVQPVWWQDEVRGLLRLDFLQPPADWQSDEFDFTVNLATMVSLGLEAARRREAERQIERLAWYDSLTGLANRNLLQQRTLQALAQAQRNKEQLALMMLDLDRFKELNDTMGHQAGDALLVRVAERLRENVRQGDTVVRMGGDEFVVLMPDIGSVDTAKQVAQQILESVRSEQMLRTLNLPVTTSIGIALYPDHGTDSTALLKHADAAMYAAKRAGRDQIAVHDPNRTNPLAASANAKAIRPQAAVNAALDQDRMVLFYQPIIALDTGRIAGFEALVRMDDPVRGLVGPDEFIGLSPQPEMVDRLTRWVLQRACAQAREWTKVLPTPVKIAVNFSAPDFENALRPAQVQAALGMQGLDPSLLSIEVTERVLQQTERASQVLGDLMQMGVEVVIDDFGVGYSGLGYLRRMPAHGLKLDRTFTRNLPQDQDSAVIAKAIIETADHFKRHVTAEGIETVEQARFMREIGSRFGQGFFFSKPLAAAQATQIATKVFEF